MKKEPENIWEAETLPADSCHYMTLAVEMFGLTLVFFPTRTFTFHPWDSLSIAMRLPCKALESIAHPVISPVAPPDDLQEPGQQRAGFQSGCALIYALSLNSTPQ